MFVARDGPGKLPRITLFKDKKCVKNFSLQEPNFIVEIHFDSLSTVIYFDIMCLATFWVSFVAWLEILDGLVIEIKLPWEIVKCKMM